MAKHNCGAMMFVSRGEEGWETWTCRSCPVPGHHSFVLDETIPLVKRLKPAPGRTVVEIKNSPVDLREGQETLLRQG